MSDINETFVVPGAGAKRIHAMTADEVLASLEWHHDEAQRLKDESDAAEARFKTRGGNNTLGETKALLAAMDAGIEAMKRVNRLSELVIAQAPPAYHDVPLKDGLPKWWGA
jgi:hypothetical protein